MIFIVVIDLIEGARKVGMTNVASGLGFGAWPMKMY